MSACNTFLWLLFMTKWLNSASFYRRPKRTKWPNLQPLFKSSTIAAISFKRQQPKNRKCQGESKSSISLHSPFRFCCQHFLFQLEALFSHSMCVLSIFPSPIPILSNQTASKYHLYKENCFASTPTAANPSTRDLVFLLVHSAFHYYLSLSNYF